MQGRSPERIGKNLRGWAFHKAWCDEYAAWTRQTAQDVYDMLWFCLREAELPQMVISTTPKPLPHVKRLVERGRLQERQAAAGGGQPKVVLTRGHMRENDANLSAVARAELEEEYAGTRLGRQELSGEPFEDVEGALWQGWMLEVEGFRPRLNHLPELQLVVIAMDSGHEVPRERRPDGVHNCRPRQAGGDAVRR
ncbi:terminase large subunit domain-containing protein [Streptomyces boninensis]|uniref:terminase large subunit domain-containing protein n=1 Tax=Streptomyces boninensis TaxID=2039455 RepID=UPI003B21D95D